MNHKTRQDVYKLAEYFFKVHCQGQGDIEHIVSILLSLATETRPAYWRRLRNAISTSFDAMELSEYAAIIKALKNPVTANDASADLKSKKILKQKRRKSVTAEEHEQIVAYLLKNEDYATLGAITIAAITGCRPSEMPLIYFGEENNSVIITSTKKTDDGVRGLDREIYLDDEQLTKIQYGVLAIRDEKNRLDCDSSNTMARIQHRLASCTKAIWPRRHHQITLYSYRHQMGSDLKDSGTGGVEAAAIMGHQSTASINRYGNRTRAQRTPDIRASFTSMMNVRAKSNSTTAMKLF